MQHIQDNREQHTEQHTEQDTEQDTEQRTDTQTQHSTDNSTYDLHTYSFDLYHEYVAIKNSNTLELYTISKENI